MNEVTILIPAFMAEAFIDRTMLFARGQTYGNISIVVSVDVSTDDTAAIVQRHAAQDERIRVVVQPERLGWAGNVNFLLDQVTTPYAFLYFHDDVIVPQYVERLVAELDDRPDAASVHCSVARFGGNDGVAPATAFDGPVAERVLAHLLRPVQGSAVRALLRMSLAGGVRIPNVAAGGLWGHVPFVVSMIAAGPALAVDEELYYRWHMRDGGLVAGWQKLSVDDVRAGWRANADEVLGIVDGLAISDPHREVLVMATFLKVAGTLLNVENQRGESLFERPEDIHPGFAAVTLPPAVDGFGEDIAEWTASRWRRLVRAKPALES